MNKRRLKWWGIFVLMLAVSASFAQSETPVSQETVEDLKKTEGDLWYADLPLPEQQQTKEKSSPNFNLPAWLPLVFKTLMWAVIAAVLAYIIYVIFQQIKLNRGTVNEVIDDDIEIESAEKLSKIDFRKSIQQALEKENYRLSIRFYYLWVIQQLSDNGSITFSKDKTNQAYIRELTKNARISPEITANFKTCTRIYEYVWFGNFAVDKTRFEEIEPQFSSILNQPTR